MAGGQRRRHMGNPSGNGVARRVQALEICANGRALVLRPCRAELELVVYEAARSLLGHTPAQLGDSSARPRRTGADSLVHVQRTGGGLWDAAAKSLRALFDELAEDLDKLNYTRFQIRRARDERRGTERDQERQQAVGQVSQTEAVDEVDALYDCHRSGSR